MTIQSSTKSIFALRSPLLISHMIKMIRDFLIGTHHFNHSAKVFADPAKENANSIKLNVISTGCDVTKIAPRTSC